MNDVYPNEKSGFISWFLSHHRMSSVAAEWLLNKIKDRDIMDRTYFVGDIFGKKCGVVITTCDYKGTDGDDFACYIDDERVTHRVLVNYMIRNTNENLYIQLRFNNKATSECLKKIMELSNENLQSVEIDIIIKTNIATHRYKEIKCEIDISLINQDKELFNKLVEEMKEIRENNPLM